MILPFLLSRGVIEDDIRLGYCAALTGYTLRDEARTRQRIACDDVPR